jgi:hypothetical protein
MVLSYLGTKCEFFHYKQNQMLKNQRSSSRNDWELHTDMVILSTIFEQIDCIVLSNLGDWDTSSMFLTLFFKYKTTVNFPTVSPILRARTSDQFLIHPIKNIHVPLQLCPGLNALFLSQSRLVLSAKATARPLGEGCLHYCASFQNSAGLEYRGDSAAAPSFWISSTLPGDQRRRDPLLLLAEHLAISA